MTLVSQVSALATRIATEFNSVRTALAGKVDTTDTRLSDTRIPTDGSVTDAKVAAGAAIAESKLNLASDAAAGTASRRTLGTGALQAAAGTHTHPYVPTTRSIATTSPLTGGGDLSADRTLGVSVGTTSGTVAAGNHTHADPTPSTQTTSGAVTLDCSVNSAHAVTATGNITGITITGTPTDGERLLLEVYASGATRTVTTTISNMSGQTLPVSISSGKLAMLGFYYSARAARWVLTYAYPEP